MEDNKLNYNFFAIENITVPDKALKTMFRLYGNGSGINWDLLKGARERALDKWPETADDINKDFDEKLYEVKLKLALKGLLYAVGEPEDEAFEEDPEDIYDNIDEFDDFDDEEEEDNDSRKV